MKDFKVGIIGATGMVGQRFVSLLENHPWFHPVVLAASSRSAGRTYEDAARFPLGSECSNAGVGEKMVVMDANADMEKIAGMVDFVFCAINMDKAQTRVLEEAYAKLECPVISNNSAHRLPQMYR